MVRKVWIGGMFLHHYAMTAIGRIMQHREWAVLAVLAAHLLFFAVELLAARLRAPGPFRSLRRRLVGVAVVGAYLLMWNRWISPEFPHVFGSIGSPQFPVEQQRLVSLLSLLIPGTLLLVSWQAMLEKPVHEVRIIRAWSKWGWKGRMLGRVFYPGWPSGVVFAFLLACSFAALLGWRDFEIWQRYQVKAGIPDYNWSDILPYNWHDLLRRSPSHWAAFTGVLIVPLVLWQWLLPNLLRWNLFGYLLIFAGTAMLQKSILALAVFMGDKGIAKWALPFPAMYWYWPAYQRPGWREFGEVIVPGVDWSSGTILILSGVVCLAWWMAALAFAARAFRSVRVVERKAEAALTAGPPVPDGSGGMGSDVAVFPGKKRPR